MAKTNYRQLKGQKEAARKRRQQSKLERRTQRLSEAVAQPGDTTSPVISVPGKGDDHG